MAQPQQDLVGGQQTEACASGLRYQQAVERVVPGQLGNVADRLGVLGGDAERFRGSALCANSQGLG